MSSSRGSPDERDWVLYLLHWQLGSLQLVPPEKPTKLYSVQFSHSVMSDSCDPMDCSTLGLPVHHQLLEFTQTHVQWVSDAIWPFHALLSPSPPALKPSQHQGLFKWVSSLHQVAKVLEFSFSVSPSNEYSGLVSFMMDWLDLLAVQGTLKSLFQYHNSEASILQCSVFFFFFFS